jgi:hypothetical protein
MENNRRSFFKGLAAFASGVVAAKVASYTPKKEEKKEGVLVTNTLTIMHEGKAYHPLVVERTEKDRSEYVSQPNNPTIATLKPLIRKANI